MDIVAVYCVRLEAIAFTLRLIGRPRPTIYPQAAITLFVSTIIFTARRVCIARTMPWEDVCPSVCLSVTSRYYV